MDDVDDIMSERRGMKALELWCRRVTEGYPGVKIENMTTSWRDGLAFCALIHHFRPDLIDFDRLDKQDIYKNNELAFRTAERQLGIPALLDPEDMVEYPVPDRLSILTYLSQFYQTFGHQGAGTPQSQKRNEILPAPSTNTNVKIIGGRQERCSVCQNTIYIAERLVIAGKLRHRSCFICARCGNKLNTVSYYETESGEFVCETCPDEVHPEPLMENEAETIPAPAPAPTEAPVPLPLPLPVIRPPDNEKATFLRDLCSVSDSDTIVNNKEELVKLEDDNAVDANELSVKLAQVQINRIEESLDTVNIVNVAVQEIPEMKLHETNSTHNEEELASPENTSDDIKLVDKLPSSTPTKDANDNPTVPAPVVFDDKPIEEDGNLLDKPIMTSDENSSDDTKIISRKSSESHDTSVTHHNQSIKDNTSSDDSKAVELPKRRFGAHVPSESPMPSSQNPPKPKRTFGVQSVLNSSEQSVTSSEDRSSDYPDELNPFNDSTDEEDDAPLPCRKVEVNERGLTVLEAPDHLNPFWSDGEDDDEEESSDGESKPVPTPRRSLLTPEPTPRSHRSSSTSLTSSTPSIGRKQKRPAPQPPIQTVSPSLEVSPTTSYRRKNRPAPPPPPPDISPSDKDAKNLANRVAQNKSVAGKWKRKKSAAPPLPMIPKRRIVALLNVDVDRELDDMEIQQSELERQGVRVEQTIRKYEEDPNAGDKDVEGLVLQLFDVVNQKNELFRRQAELMYLRRQQRLEEEHADLEYQIRVLMGQPERNKTDSDKEREEILIRRLIDVVQQRSEIVDCLDMNRRREVEEDRSIQKRLEEYVGQSSGDSGAKDEDSLSTAKRKHNILKLLKKKYKKDKVRTTKPPKIDKDKDIDESLDHDFTEKSNKTKKKWLAKAEK